MKIENPKNNDNKEKLFIAATELFASEGYHKVSVREICEAAGVSKPVLYYYFKDKENLLEELINETYLRFDKLKEEHISKEETFEGVLRGVVKIYISFIKDSPHLSKFSAVLQSVNVPEKILNRKIVRYRKDKKEFVDLIKLNQKKGVLSDSIDAETLFSSFLGPILVYVIEVIVMGESITTITKKMNTFVEFWINTYLNKEVK